MTLSYEDDGVETHYKDEPLPEQKEEPKIPRNYRVNWDDPNLNKHNTGDVRVLAPTAPPMNPNYDIPGTAHCYAAPPAIHIQPRPKLVNPPVYPTGYFYPQEYPQCYPQFYPQPVFQQVPQMVQQAQPVQPVQQQTQSPKVQAQCNYSVRVLNVAQDRFDPQGGPIQVRNKYLNHTNRRLYVTTMDDVSYPIEPAAIYPQCPPDGGHVEVLQETMLIGRAALAELERLLNFQQPEVISPELKDLMLAIAAAKGHPENERQMSEYGIVVTRSWAVRYDWFDDDGRYFIPYLNVYLSDSESGARKSFGSSYLHELRECLPEDAMGFFVTVIDNENEAGKRYMYSAGRVHGIPPIRDPSMKSGVYISTQNASFDKVAHYLTFEEAQKELHMYDNRSDALTNGHPENYYKVAAQRRQHELEEERMVQAKQMQKLQTAMAREKHEFEKELLELRAQREREQAEHERQMNEVKRENEEMIAQMRHQIEQERASSKLAYEQELSKLKKMSLIEDDKRKDLEHLRQQEFEDELRRRQKKFAKEDRKRKKKLEKEDRLLRKKREEEDREHERRRQEEDLAFRRKMETERFERERERLRMQDIYEDRSYRRKDDNEMIKQIPLYVTAALAAFTAFSTYQSNRTGKSLYNNSIIDI